MMPAQAPLDEPLGEPTDTRHAAALLAWYRQHRRSLPWRAEPGESADPYHVLVSELMCQQTRVQTVIPYFERWMQRWPTLEKLAAADEDEVVQLWTGLGYYRRARFLLQAAKAAATLGGLPADPAKLRALPGIGRYTAGAIASIAFGMPTALVDGNVARVLARWHALAEDVSRGAGQRRVWALAERWLREDSARSTPGDWNQALMELGALVCAPRQPACAACPVATTCSARRQGLELKLPVARKRTVVQPVRASYAVILRRDEVLVAQRSRSGRWAGLWEPPGIEGERAAERLRSWSERWVLRLSDPADEVQHVLSHRRYLCSPMRAEPEDPGLLRDQHSDRWRNAVAELGYLDARFLPVDDALGDRSGLSRLAQKLIEAMVHSNLR